MHLVQPKTSRWLLLAMLCTCAVFFGKAMAANNSFEEIRRGRYLVKVGDCVACHSAPDGEYMAGGKRIPTPFGDIYSRNITPDQQTGIGSWDLDQFIRAMREGVSADGSHLYPAFPYPYFSRVTEQDLAAIWSYLQSIDPVHNEVQSPDLLWPMEWRKLMVGWKLLFFEPAEFEYNPEQSEQWNRGAYLVTGLGHCGACHSPKNVFGAATDDVQEKFTGSELQQWFAPDLTHDFDTGLGDWSKEDIVQYLKTGTNGDQVAAGLMREVVEKSTQYITEEDLYAVATYLKNLPGSSETSEDSDEQMSDNSTSEDSNELGQALFIDNCAGCHRYNGEGMEGVFPKLKGSPIVLQENPASLIHVVLRGAQHPSTEARPNMLQMPNFDWKLGDKEIAALLTYIRSAWGNEASSVESDAVAELREATELEPEPNWSE